MKKLFFVMAAVVVAAVGYTSPSFAQAPGLSDNKGQRDNPSAVRLRKAYGTYVTLSQAADATYEAVSFGFISDYVEVCLEDDSSRVYVRFDNALPANATSAANFITDPNTSEKALPMFGGGDGTDVACVNIPAGVNGLVFHSGGNASVDVRAYGE